MAATWSGRRFAWSTKRGVYRGPRLARQGGAGRTGGGALPAGPRPSHRHLPATRKPDDKFYLVFGFGPGLLPSDAMMLGIDPETQRDRMADAIDIITRLLEGEVITQESCA